MKEVFLLYFIPFVLIQTIAGQGGIMFSPKPENKLLSKKETNDFYVSCMLTPDTPSKEDAVFTWFDNAGKEITNRDITGTQPNPYIQETSRSLKLGFIHAKTGDSGTYKCKADVNGQIYEDSFVLEVKASLKSRDCDKEQSGLIGSEHIVKCVASAGGTLVLSDWFFKGKLINTANSEKYRIDKTGLVILNVSTEDEGPYLYNAYTGNGDQVFEDIQFQAVGLPRFLGPIYKQTAIKGKRVEMICTATARPEVVKIEWKKGSSQIVGTDRIEVNDGSTGDKASKQKILIIKEVTREDQGKYTCTAYGVHVEGKDVRATHEVDLEVQIPPTIAFPRPAPTGIEGKTATISCTAFGDPAPDMVWQKEGQDGQYLEGASGDNIVVYKQVQLEPSKEYKVTFNITFRKVTNEDAGNYICKGMNNAGNASKTVTFDVKYGPKFIDPVGEFYTWRPKNAGTTTDTAIECVVQSNPPAHFEWFKDNKKLSGGGFYEITLKRPDPNDKSDHTSKSTLTVKFNGGNRDVLGSYKCNATNDYGTGGVGMELVEAGLPPKPKIEDIDRRATAYIFYLTQPKTQGPPVTRFKVVYAMTANTANSTTREVERETRPIIDADRQYTKLIVEGLQHDTEYSFTLFSISPVGESVGLELTETTPIIKNPGKVAITTPSNVDTGTFINVKWDEPADGGSPIQFYTLKYQRVTFTEKELAALKPNDEYGPGQPVEAARTVPTKIATQQYKLERLLPGSFYRISVTAHNSLVGSPGMKTIKTRKDDFYKPISEAPQQVATYVTIVGCLAALCACLKSFV